MRDAVWSTRVGVVSGAVAACGLAVSMLCIPLGQVTAFSLEVPRGQTARLLQSLHAKGIPLQGVTGVSAGGAHAEWVQFQTTDAAAARSILAVHTSGTARPVNEHPVGADTRWRRIRIFGVAGLWR